jgi:hypothetical protein
MEAETKAFVLIYSLLYEKCVNAKTTQDLVEVMYRLSGGQLNPLAVFNKSGDIKSFPILLERTNDMFRRIFKVNAKEQVVCFFLNMNQTALTQIDSPRLGKRMPRTQRANLLQSGIIAPHVFFDSHGQVR